MSMALPEAHVPGKISPVSFRTVGLIEEPALKKLQGELAEITGQIARSMGHIRLRLINCATVEEFSDLRKKSFQSYLDLNMAISNVVGAFHIDPIEYAHMGQEALNETEKELTANAQLYLGEEAYKELLFCIATLKSTVRLLPRLQSIPPSDEGKEKDHELADNFFVTNAFVSLHLECLKMAMARNQTLNPEILSEIMSGIRQAVMVYSFARMGLELRNFPASRYSEKLDIPWDHEDEELSKAV
jgi:hypothetical protein